MTRFLFLFAILSVMLTPAMTKADTQPDPGLVVIELYTSQGCSSCPPADALLARLAQRDDVLPLALHVDYWDYLGWKDAFASPAYTARQKGYAHVAGRKMIYTPQMVVMGREDIVGTDAMAVADLVAAYRSTKPVAHVDLRREGAKLKVLLQPGQQGASTATPEFVVQLVRFTPEQTVDIRRGENAGRSVSYVNVVDGWDTLGRWDGQSERILNIDVSADRPAAILVQQAGLGPIVAAAMVR